MKKIFEETSIGDLHLANRIIRSGTWMSLATENGELTPELLAKYTELAQSEIGMIICGYARVDELEKANNGMIGMFNPELAEQYQTLTKVFKKHNIPVGIQLALGGTQIHYQGDVTWKILSPSSAEIKRQDASGNQVTYHVEAMTIDEIKQTIAKFAQAAVNVKNAGFDLIQIHAGHGYFLSQWMNPELNRRDDEYGQNPSLFIRELYTAVRVAVGNEMKIGIKLNSEEHNEDHSNYAAMLDLCESLDQMGIDLIEVTGCAPSRTRITPEKESYFAEFAKLLTKRVNCQTMLTGGNKTFKQLETVLNETGIDYIGLSRPLISEPDLVQKWQANPEYQTKCISCNHCHRKVYTCVFDK